MPIVNLAATGNGNIKKQKKALTEKPEIRQKTILQKNIDLESKEIYLINMLLTRRSLRLDSIFNQQKERIMCASVLGKTRLIFSVVVTAVFSMLVLVGCGDGDKGTGLNNKGSNLGGDESKLILADKYAWVNVVGGVERNKGYIFKSDGTFTLVTKDFTTNEWAEQSTGGGKWSDANGTTISITYDQIASGTAPYEYTISADGTTFTFQFLTYEKRDIGISTNSDGNNNNLNGLMWFNEDDNYGFYFDGTTVYKVVKCGSVYYAFDPELITDIEAFLGSNFKFTEQSLNQMDYTKTPASITKASPPCGSF
ncbi:MAG: hypothetical protein LBI42_14985 [Chitinispirillales bacterium]|jgi:hypothetical protein|nr:hypothetical protein [Chitinispirillales bacterium]